MALIYNLGYQESISVHPTRCQNFAGKPYSNFPNIWEWLISQTRPIPRSHDGDKKCDLETKKRFCWLLVRRKIEQVVPGGRRCHSPRKRSFVVPLTFDIDTLPCFPLMPWYCHYWFWHLALFSWLNEIGKIKPCSIMFAALWKLGGGWHGHLLTVNCTVSTWHGWTHNLW